MAHWWALSDCESHSAACRVTESLTESFTNDSHKQVPLTMGFFYVYQRQDP